jgi:hypothetical protein
LSGSCLAAARNASFRLSRNDFMRGSGQTVRFCPRPRCRSRLAGAFARVARVVETPLAAPVRQTPPVRTLVVRSLPEPEIMSLTPQEAYNSLAEKGELATGCAAYAPISDIAAASRADANGMGRPCSRPERPTGSVLEFCRARGAHARPVHTDWANKRHRSLRDGLNEVSHPGVCKVPLGFAWSTTFGRCSANSFRAASGSTPKY